MEHAFWPKLLSLAAGTKQVSPVSDLIMSPGRNLLFIRDGLLESDGETVPDDFFRGLMAELSGRSDGLPEQDGDYSHQYSGQRFRINFYRSMGHPKLVARVLPKEALPLEKVGIPPKVLDRMMGGVDRGGLILVTGPTGSGKNTTVAAFLNHLVIKVPGHIVTLEDPIEYLIGAGTGFEYRVSQREIGRDVPTFHDGLKSILRQAPKIVFIGEIRDRATASLAIEAAQTGHLVISTLHTTTAAETVDRMLRFFTAAELPYVSATLSECLCAVLCQRLVRRIDQKSGRVAVMETLVPTLAIRRMIADTKVADIRAQMQTGRNEGNYLFEHAFKEAERAGLIAPDPDRALK